MDRKIDSEKAIRELVKSNMKTFAQTFSKRHISEIDDPNGTINMKIHNVFIAALGEEFQYYTALVRSFDSSLGNMLETLAVSIAGFFYDVTDKVNGPLYPAQTAKIAELLEAYKNRKNPKKVSVNDYKLLREIEKPESETTKVHVSDFYLYDKEKNEYFLIELKIGGDLDNKKARSEKEAIFEQYAILSNTLDKNAKIKCFFATAYNRYGEGKPWKQGRVKQFFSEEELLIGKDFWNFICKSDNGYDIIIDEYKKNADIIKNAFEISVNEIIKTKVA
ncbi:MAG: TdeIII family type II restriction endonuclease [Candidatus Marinimicrobia bacterium]|nr:TdeIII family type II restriction endonuclease [Candidatus Neomarinimicrobiota bacterium]